MFLLQHNEKYWTNYPQHERHSQTMTHQMTHTEFQHKMLFRSYISHQI